MSRHAVVGDDGRSRPSSLIPRPTHTPWTTLTVTPTSVAMETEKETGPYLRVKST